MLSRVNQILIADWMRYWASSTNAVAPTSGVFASYSAVCAETGRENVPRFCGENSAPLTSRCTTQCGSPPYASWWNGSSNKSQTATLAKGTSWNLFHHKDHDILSVEWTWNHYVLPIKRPRNSTVTGRNQGWHRISDPIKLLATLQLLASGSFQTVTASAVGITQSALSRVTATVRNALLQRTSQLIYFHTTNAQ